MKPDAKDLALLHALEGNARARLSELGRATRLSKAAVAQRISHLESEGFIEGYYALVDASALGFMSVRAYVKFSGSSPAREKKFFASLARDKRVWWLGRIQGEWDAGFVAWVRSLSEFAEFWEKLERRHGSFFGRREISPYLRLRAYPLDFISEAGREAKRKPASSGGEKEAEIDGVDRKILRALSKNSRAPLVEIARQSGVSPVVVKYRVRALEKKGVIKGFRAAVNTVALGYSLYKIDFSFNDVSRRAELAGFLEGFPGIAYIDETLESDLEADFYLRNQMELDELLGKVKARFHSSLRECNYFVYARVLKYSRFPG
ncbi:putative HTH-type transcriptional regulator [uncultured archaeon]|nr:putative HTH-type transcriptional regulator [uncultured archaeon]